MTFTTQMLIDNAGWIVTALIFFYTRHRDKAKKALTDALALKTVQDSIGELGRQHTNMWHEFSALKGALEAHTASMRQIDTEFWKEKWPKVERVIEKLDAIERRVEALEDWRRDQSRS